MGVYRGGSSQTDSVTSPGYVTSGAYGYSVIESLALGYLRSHVTETGAGFEVEINGKRRAASVSDGARYDSQGLRMRL